MMSILFPLIVVAVVGALCLNLKIGFIVSELTERTGFNFGFYMITVMGLTAVEISLVVYLLTN